MRRALLVLALLTLAPAAHAEDRAPVPKELAGLTPQRVYQLLTAQPSVPADAPRTLKGVLNRTGLSLNEVVRLVGLQRQCATKPIRLPWLTDAKVPQRRASRVKISTPTTLDQAASTLRGLYAQGRIEAAATLIERDPRLRRWDDLPAGTTVRCWYDRDLVVVIKRSAQAPDALVVIPPGTVAKAAPDGQRWGSAQDLALLRPGLLRLRTPQTRIQVPVACASYGYSGPGHGHPYRLALLPTDSRLSQLLRHIPTTSPTGPVAQLAVWIAGNDIASVRWSDTRTMRGLAVQPSHVDDAARLILGSGIDPRLLNLFGGADARP